MDDLIIAELIASRSQARADHNLLLQEVIEDELRKFGIVFDIEEEK